MTMSRTAPVNFRRKHGFPSYRPAATKGGARLRPWTLKALVLLGLPLAALSQTNHLYLSQQWRLAAGDRPYLQADGAQGGLAYRPQDGHLLFVSRAGAPAVHVLNARTGADLYALRSTDQYGQSLIFGGLYPLHLIAVAADGAVYVANLSTNGYDFTIYRWGDDASNTIPTVAFGPETPGIAPAGETFAVTGSGVDTQFLVGTTNSTQIAWLTTNDGTNFTSATIDLAGSIPGGFGTGLAFGGGEIFWATLTSSNQSLMQAQILLVPGPIGVGVGTGLQSFGTNDFPAAVGPIAVDPAAQLLAGIKSGAPDTLQLYRIAPTNNPPVFMDQAGFPGGQTNDTGIGAVAFGTNLVFAVDGNNGLLAEEITTQPTTPPASLQLVQPGFSQGGAFQFVLKGTALQNYLVEAASGLNRSNWTILSTNRTGSDGTVQVIEPPAPGGVLRFYRARTP